MLGFEGYFGMSIKFFNPTFLVYVLCNNLASDIDQPFGEEPTARMLAFATIYIVIALIIILVPLFACNYPETFEHNVNKEFMADQLFEAKLRMARKIKKTAKAKTAKDHDTTELVGLKSKDDENDSAKLEAPAKITDGEAKKD